MKQVLSELSHRTIERKKKCFEEVVSLLKISTFQVPGRGEPNSEGELDYNYLLCLLDKLQYKVNNLENLPIIKTSLKMQHSMNKRWDGI